MIPKDILLVVAVPFSKKVVKTRFILILVVLAAMVVPSMADKVDDLILDLKYGSNDIRKDAVVALGEIKDSRTVDPLIVALDDESWDI